MITVFQFRNRFTAAEKRAIEFAMMDNPAASMEQRAMSADLRVAMTDLLASEATDLTFNATIEGVRNLTLAGLLAPHRFFEILDADAGGGVMDKVVLKADHPTRDGLYAVAQNCEQLPDELVLVYVVGDINKTAVAAAPARYIATGE